MTMIRPSLDVGYGICPGLPSGLGSAPAVYLDHVTLNVVPIWIVLTSEEEGEVI